MERGWEGKRDEQLQEIADSLLFRLHQMLDGVRCGFDVYPDPIQGGSYHDKEGDHSYWLVRTRIACADISTGISTVETLPQSVQILDLPPDPFCQPIPELGVSCDRKKLLWAEPNCDPAALAFSCDLRKDDPDFLTLKVIPLIEPLYRHVLLQLPIYELRSMIDTLHLYLSHAPDLTATLQRIPVERPPTGPGIPVLPLSGLCLAWQEQLVGSITADVVVLLPCTGEDRQRWVYTRAAQPDNPDPRTTTTLIPGGEIRNPSTDTCLDVESASPMADARLQIFDCNGTDAQKWTYDPMTRVLQSAVSTVLDTPGGNGVCWPDGRSVECIGENPVLFFPPNGLRMWWRTEDASQQWHADLAGDPNADGKVDCSDLAIVRSSLGKRSGQAGFDFRADVNSDGVVDVRDLAFVARKLPVGMRCP
jgi:hypothetical protein